jgi:hypothetical protein
MLPLIARKCIRTIVDWKRIAPLLFSVSGFAQSIVADKSSFAVTSAAIYVDPGETELVKTAATLLQQDIEQVTGKKIPLISAVDQVGKNLIVIGTLQQSAFVKQLVAQGKINPDAINGKWEASLLQTVNNPAKGVKQALIIAGNDRRGVAYGVFELSRQVGVSPWYWWADVPVVKRKELFIQSNVAVADAPKVKYRGIFLNDEAPALSGWTR